MLNSRLLTLGLIAVLSVLGIHIAGKWTGGVRADLTADDLYSLSPGTVAILERIREEGVQPIAVDLYFSETAGKTLPRFIKDFVTYERYLRYLLGEYERAAGGRIEVSFIDPVPDSDEAQDALDFGLEGRPINQHGDQFFFGLVFTTQTGSRDVIEFLWPDQQEAVEYEISKQLSRMVWPSGQKIGVLSSLEVMGTEDNPYLAQMLAAQGKTPSSQWIALELLEEIYEVEALPADVDRIDPEDLDLLVVIHPKDLPDKTLFAIDEWVVRGGNTLVFVDPYSVGDPPPNDPQQPWRALQYKPSSNLGALLSAWGVERPEDQVAADFELATRRRVDPRGGAESVLIDLEILGDDLEEALASDHPILQGLTSLRFFMAGQLEIEERPGVTVVPLVTTTAAGNTLEIKPGFGGSEGLVFTDVNSPAKLRDRFVSGQEPVTLAAMLQGKLPSAFPDGGTFPAEEPERPPGLPPGVDLPTPEGAELITREPVPEADRAAATVLVFADVDLIADAVAFQQTIFGVQAANDNHKVLLNGVDFLLGAEELLNVRSKSAVERPFELFDAIEAEAEKESLDRERQIRADVESFQEELSAKQAELSGANAALFEKRIQDEVDRLNDNIRERNRELFEIRKERRAALESEESKVRFSVMGWMPVVVLAVGVALGVRRRRQNR